MRKLKTTIVNILFIISLIALTWISVSFIEINVKNDTVNPVYNEHNFFIVMNDFGQFLNK